MSKSVSSHTKERWVEVPEWRPTSRLNPRRWFGYTWVLDGMFAWEPDEYRTDKQHAFASLEKKYGGE